MITIDEKRKFLNDTFDELCTDKITKDYTKLELEEDDALTEEMYHFVVKYHDRLNSSRFMIAKFWYYNKIHEPNLIKGTDDEWEFDENGNMIFELDGKVLSL